MLTELKTNSAHDSSALSGDTVGPSVTDYLRTKKGGRAPRKTGARRLGLPKAFRATGRYLILQQGYVPVVGACIR